MKWSARGVFSPHRHAFHSPPLHLHLFKHRSTIEMYQGACLCRGLVDLKFERGVALWSRSGQEVMGKFQSEAAMGDALMCRNRTTLQTCWQRSTFWPQHNWRPVLLDGEIVWMNVEQMAADCLYPEMIPGYDFGICRPPVNERTIEYYEPELMSTTVNCVFFGRNENIFSYLNKNN